MHHATNSRHGIARSDLDLSVIIPALDEADNLRLLVPELADVLTDLGIRYEILVVTRSDDDDTRKAAAECGAVVIEQAQTGYGSALLDGLAGAAGTYALTMDADLSHRPTFIHDMWRRRDEAEITIASRFVPGGCAHMPIVRRLLSRLLNMLFRQGLGVPVRDLSSGFRLYHTSVLHGQHFDARDFDILQQILVRAYSEGWRVQEVPFAYAPRKLGASHARVLRVGKAYLRTFWPLFRLRNSIMAADYDDRAYDSPIPLQRYWQRTRYRHIAELIAGEGPVLDVGCGSSRIIGALPPGSVALDILMRKLRYARKFEVPLVHGSGFSLPFRAGAFPCVLCSEVIEHVPKDSPIIDEMCRVTAPGGRLVIGTPDYNHWQWVWFERAYAIAAPSGYADEHIARYTLEELVELLAARGFRHEETRYIMQGELIAAFRKPPS